MVCSALLWSRPLTSACGEMILSLRQATDFLLQVFAAAVVSWADHHMALLLGVRARWFPWQHDDGACGLQPSEGGEQSFTLCLQALPLCLPLLLARQPWSSSSHKVWLAD